MKLTFTISLIILVHLLPAQQVARPLVPDWEQTYSWDDHILLSERCAGGDIIQFSQPADRKLHLKRFSEEGSLILHVAFPDFQAIDKVHIAACKEDAEGNFYILLTPSERLTLLVKFSREGNILFSQTLIAAMKQGSLSHGFNLFLKDSTVACYGIKGGAFWEAMVHQKGAILSESLFDWEEDDFVADIILGATGEPIILSRTESNDANGNYYSTSHVMKINHFSHRLEKWNSFPGTNGSICRLENGNYAVTVDTSRISLQQSFVLHILDRQLVLRNSIKLFDNKSGLSPAKVFSWRKGLIGVAAIRDDKFNLVGMDTEGKTVTGFRQPGNEKVVLLKSMFMDEKHIGCFLELDFGGKSPKEWFRGKQVVYSMNNLMAKE